MTEWFLYVDSDITCDVKPLEDCWFDWRDKLRDRWSACDDGARLKVLAQLLVFHKPFCVWLTDCYASNGFEPIDGPESMLMSWVHRPCSELKFLWETTRS